MDYRTMFDSEYLGAWDLPRDVTVTIATVKAGQLVGEKGRTAKKPIITFVGKQKGFAANKTNCKTIAAMYGTNTKDWIGKRITLYATTTEFGGKQMDCIRVRPQVPTAAAKRAQNGGAAAAPPDADVEHSEHEHDADDDADDEQSTDESEVAHD
jgi:hypothetical protein